MYDSSHILISFFLLFIPDLNGVPIDMKSMLVENGENGQRVYDSLLVEPKNLGIFGNDLAVKIIGELARQPLCAMDIGKKLRQNEQKIYYHLRKMRDAGIVRQAGTESRYGMTAKFFELVSPVIATKLHENGYSTKTAQRIVDPDVEEFLDPFVKDGKLNAKIIIGDPYSHGRFDEGASEGPFTFDFAMLLGRFTNSFEFPCYKLDTEVTEKDLKENLILMGNSKTNVVLDKVNKSLPLYFDETKDYRLVSKTTKHEYSDPRIGLVIKSVNPFNKNKKLLIIGGVGSRGARAAILACTMYFSKTFINASENNGTFARIVKGYDRSGNKVIDSIETLE